MRKYLLLLTLLCNFLWTQPNTAQTSTSVAGTVVLNIENRMDYTRTGWQVSLAVQAGTFLSVEDLVFPQTTSLIVLCPDGSLKDFVPSELFPNDKINCDVPRENWVITVDGIQRVNIQRGGRQDPTIPYLIAPRGTLIRNSTLELSWNAPPNVLEYHVRIFGNGGEVLPKTRFLPADVEQGDIATTQLTLNLQANTAYTTEICVTFQDLRSGCTTDPGWSSGTNLAFYYVPNPLFGKQPLSSVEKNVINSLGKDTPESLYARSVLLSQPNEHGLGFNSEALDLLNRLIEDHPSSPLKLSPDVYLRLGNLYR